MGRRTLLLMAALAVAALGTVLVYLYVRGLEREYALDQQLKTVLVAQRPIAAGTSVEQAEANGAFNQARLPEAAVVPGALGGLTGLEGRVALAPIYPGEQILAAKFGEAASNTFAIPDPEENSPERPGPVAVTVALGENQRSGNYVKAGSEVAVMVTYGSEGDLRTRMLLPRVRVLATGGDLLGQPARQGQPAAEQEAASGLVTLALGQEEAQIVVNAQAQGTLYLALLDDESRVAAGVLVTPEDWSR